MGQVQGRLSRRSRVRAPSLPPLPSCLLLRASRRQPARRAAQNGSSSVGSRSSSTPSSVVRQGPRGARPGGDLGQSSHPGVGAEPVAEVHKYSTWSSGCSAPRSPDQRSRNGPARARLRRGALLHRVGPGRAELERDSGPGRRVTGPAWDEARARDGLRPAGAGPRDQAGVGWLETRGPAAATSGDTRPAKRSKFSAKSRASLAAAAS